MARATATHEADPKALKFFERGTSEVHHTRAERLGAGEAINSRAHTHTKVTNAFNPLGRGADTSRPSVIPSGAAAKFASLPRSGLSDRC